MRLYLLNTVTLINLLVLLDRTNKHFRVKLNLIDFFAFRLVCKYIAKFLRETMRN